jgi:hypothetical protein
MKRDLLYVYVESFGTTTPVPVNSEGNPIWDGYSGRTLQVLQDAYERGKDDIVIIPDPEPILILIQPDWNGLYKSLMVTEVYQHLVGLSSTITAVTSTLDKSVDAIQYGIMRPDDVDAFTAFQSALNLLFYSLGAVNQSLSPERLAQIRAALDSNGFEEITHELFE